MLFQHNVLTLTCMQIGISKFFLENPALGVHFSHVGHFADEGVIFICAALVGGATYRGAGDAAMLSGTENYQYFNRKYDSNILVENQMRSRLKVLEGWIRPPILMFDTCDL
ncbi:hypothetical protein NL108_003752 [Boleophthalmus pectinirostris]|nr:hypothetical protein NL108_003752 [Boleophthalmus pectinirostris]